MSYSRPSPHFQTNLVAREGYNGVGGLQSFGTGIKDFLLGTAQVTNAGLDIFAPRGGQTVVSEPTPWIPILAVTGLAIGAIVLLRKK
jgi:hypothetical protein